MLLAVTAHSANVQDREGAEPLLRQTRRLFPSVERLIGDAGGQGPTMAAAVARTFALKPGLCVRRLRFVLVTLGPRHLRRAMRKHHSAEDNIRIVMEGLGSE